MSHRYAYCSWCGGELEVTSIELHTKNLFWGKCKGPRRCPGRKQLMKTDPQGFVLEPHSSIGRYLFSKP